MADNIFDSLPLFEEAIKFFKDKVPLTPKEFYRLEQEYKAKAFTISGIVSLDILNDILNELQKVLDEGITFNEWRKSVNDLLERKGWDGLSPYRADNVFRTNIQTAYSVGSWKRMNDADVVKKRPYGMYDAVNDSRTRPTHLAMDRRVFPLDHPIWDTWWPPNGYRCRCAVRSLSERDVQRMGLTVETKIPEMVTPPGQLARHLVPDPGFDQNPAKKAWEPDMSKYPDDLKRAYLRRAERS
ncbi:phage head morphogenesis protein [Desulfotruncus alcoholivorax]|uniref:phage head morphogenesis protein n=1 Tax=Desulfotruncus alcoholivorax TaxID=265477 RepID=UPI0003F75BDB|nr:phage minor head protein [Desulfotruncus alcoholivorax]